MATTKMWPVKASLAAPLDYITQDTKTVRQAEPETPVDDSYTAQELMALRDVMDFFGQETERRDLEKVLGYVAQGCKTDEEKFVTGINCDVSTAKQEMELVKRQWQKEGGNLCMHCYQSFAPDEATPELAHLIGTELAKTLWGGRFQVVVATHLDRQHVHNHFVINSVSFSDGKRFHYGQEAYDIFRITSDRLCREYGLSVIERPKRGRQVNPNAYEKAGVQRKPVYYKLIIRDIDNAISQSRSMNDFFRILRQKGYTFRSGNLKYFTLRHPDADKDTRIDKWAGEDYSLAGIERRIKQQPQFRPTHHAGSERPAQQTKIRYRGSFRADSQRKPRSRFRRMYLYYCYVFGVFPQHRKHRAYVSKAEVRKMQNISKETQMLFKNKIDTMAQLEEYRAARQQAVDTLCSQRKPLYNQLRYAADQEIPIIQKSIDLLTAQIKTQREQIRLCDDIRSRAARQQAAAEQAQQQNENTTTQKEDNKNGHDPRRSQRRDKSDPDVSY